MPVVICYRHNERLDAFILNERLLLEDVPTQLVQFDSTGQTTEDLCGGLCQQLSDATHLIGVLSSESAQRWWTAWLMGAAVMASRRVSLYQSGAQSLPEHLGKWPVMRSREHIELFVRAYHDERTFERAMSLPAVRLHSVDRSNADFFHADLKAKIRRGF